MKNWYINNQSPNITSGYENDVMSEYAQSNFADILETLFSDSVILYNYDLSESRQVRCIIQGNMADTQLKSTQRTILFPIGTSKAGMYVFFENSYWLITGYPGNNKSYEKAIVALCQYHLKWQNSKGDIIERYTNGSSASDIKESGTKAITTYTGAFVILLPNDDECLELDEKRVFIDSRKINPTKVYKITRNDDISYDYGYEHGGVLSYIANKTEFNKDVDNQELRICDYFSPTPSQPETPNESTVLTAHINYTGSDIIRIGGNSKVFTATLTDADGIEKDMIAIWIVEPSDGIHVTKNGNILTISCNNQDLDGETITISVTDYNSGFSTLNEFTLSVF